MTEKINFQKRVEAAEAALFADQGSRVMNTFVNDEHLRHYVTVILRAGDAAAIDPMDVVNPRTGRYPDGMLAEP